MSIFDTIFSTLQAPMAVIAGTEDELRFIRTNDAFDKLVGYTEDELIGTPPTRLFSAWNNHIGRINDRSGSFLLQLKINRTMRIRLTWEPIANTEVPTFLLIAEDITAKTWIEMMGKSRKVLLSGIVNKDFIIERYIQNYPAPMFDYQLKVEDQSVFEFLSENDRERLTRIMEQAVIRKQTDSLVVCTKKLANMAQLEIDVTFCPFYCGNGSLKHYGFVVTDIKPVMEPIDSAVLLKILMARKHMSAQQLAEATGISLQTISKLRNGKIGKPQRLTAELIATELNVSPQDIWPQS
ncbi:helix-turn-helix domain-containing protein [Paenibacillus solisilvae]|uniref:Helix-turn-helix domain-containing protein n=1 Tax=Paenibacillus solisilvae TaxID=2486751 RepID=A0ABW0W3N8_9BACL